MGIIKKIIKYFWNYFIEKQNSFQLIKDKKLPLNDLVVVDDFFPGELSIWRNKEFAHYASKISKIHFFCRTEHYKKGNLKASTTFEEDVIKIINKYPELRAESISILGRKNFINTKLLYCLFYKNIRLIYKFLDKYQIPFVFTLYPGGGFTLYNTEVDSTLSSIFKSPYFRKVIVNQAFVRDYLINRGFTSPDKIEYIYGVPLEIKHSQIKKKYFGKNKKKFDICFVGAKYQVVGLDKGFDSFAKVASILSKNQYNISFHCVGGFNKDDETILGISSNINYYGYLNPDELRNFFSEMDCIVSPNRAFCLSSGAFDGFPTASVVEAALNGVLMVCSDPFDVASDIGFIHGKDYLLISDQVSSIVKTIINLYEVPDEIEIIAKSGQSKCQKLFSDEYQLDKRVQILKTIIQNDTSN